VQSEARGYPAIRDWRIMLATSQGAVYLKKRGFILRWMTRRAISARPYRRRSRRAALDGAAAAPRHRRAHHWPNRPKETRRGGLRRRPRGGASQPVTHDLDGPAPDGRHREGADRHHLAGGSLRTSTRPRSEHDLPSAGTVIQRRRRRRRMKRMRRRRRRRRKRFNVGRVLVLNTPLPDWSPTPTASPRRAQELCRGRLSALAARVMSQFAPAPPSAPRRAQLQYRRQRPRTRCLGRAAGGTSPRRRRPAPSAPPPPPSAR